MRRALDNYLPITTVHGQAGYGHFGKHAGYDYGVVKQPVKAPEAGTITAVYLGRENVDGGNIVELRSGKYDHRFLHLLNSKVKVGDKVTEGQVIGTSGNTGNVGYHLHHDVRTKGTAWTASYANYVDWEKLIKPVAPPQGGNDMADASDVKHLYRYGPLGRTADASGLKHYTGKKTDFILHDMANSKEGKEKAAQRAQELKDLRDGVAKATRIAEDRAKRIAELEKQLGQTPTQPSDPLEKEHAGFWRDLVNKIKRS